MASKKVSKPKTKAKTKAKAKAKTFKPSRPPIVVVVGHVDHGKTTLLDTIRKANIVKGEAGGITQHIGAYQVQTDPKKPDTRITFIDTPGHEAFGKMRQRGVTVADIAILVVAINEGVKPQTKEAINFIKQADLPFIVAINKIDLPDTNPDLAKAQLAEAEVFVEGYGGDVVAVPISAQKGKGIDQLLEMVHLLYELQEHQKLSNKLKAVVMESKVIPQAGVTANILILDGTLKHGDTIYADDGQSAKIRRLTSDLGKTITKATASQPVQVLGFKSVVEVGSLIASEPLATKALPEEPVTPTPEPESTPEPSKPEPETEADQEPKADPEAETEVPEEPAEKPRLKVIIKADVAGTLEAIKANLTEEIDLVHSGVGDISESDILLSRSTGARVIGFHVRVPSTVKKLAEMEEVKIETFDVIYHLLEDLQKRVLKMLEPTIDEEELGKAKVIAEFKIRGTHVAGCKVESGTIVRSEKIKVIRGKKVIGRPRIAALQIERKDATEAKKGQEVALVFRPDVKFKEGDTVISYKEVD